MLRNNIYKLLLGLALSGCASETTAVEQATEVAGTDCVFTQGYWKNHPEAWPVDRLTLGNIDYTKDELLAIFNTPVKGNGLIQLAHQLIAAKLNVANGGDSSISDEIAAADALIGNLVVGIDTLPTGNALVGQLDTYNNNADCAGPACGDGNIDDGEQCDDGNTSNGDGCSSTCQNEEKVPCCGDGVMDAGEQCDDGNTVDGDGCSSTCQLEEKAPCCGDGVIDIGEQCDDSNTVDGDGCSSTCQTEVCLIK
jgi:cysteine-rich repeat protein